MEVNTAAGPSMQRHRDWAGGMGTTNTAINQKMALSAAYAELGKELSSTKLKTIGSYTIGKMIGEGTYGKVRLGNHRLSGTRVAIKQIPKAHSASLTREIHHHRRLHHPNVMQLYEVMATESYIWMVTELCAGGELYDYLVERGTMPEPEARRIFGQLCLAVAYVHDRGIVHRDIKLENILLDERCNVKLGDFGFTREYEGKKLMDTFCGTTGYAAPEMLAGRKYTGQEVDIWSLGIILYALLCGALPFDDDDELVMKEKILKGEFELPEELSEDSRELISQILQLDPHARPPIKSILDHVWFHKVMLPTTMATVEEDDNGDDSARNEGSETHNVVASAAEVEEAPGSERLGDVLPPKANSADDLTHRASLSAFSDKSYFSANSKSDSESSDRQSNQTETTAPTVEDGEEMDRIVSVPAKPTAYPSNSNREVLHIHRNESQSTIKRAGSSGSEGSRKGFPGATAMAKGTPSPMPTHHEAPSISEQTMSPDENSAAPTSQLQVDRSVPLEKHNSQGSSRTGHHRTPSRTKRGSSGGLSDHVAPTLEFKPIDFVALLDKASPAIFSTVTEQNILHQLSRLGMDVGQIVHSVVNEACDASGALWWMLKKKAEERQGWEAEYDHSPMMSTLRLASPPPSVALRELSPSRRSSLSESHQPDTSPAKGLLRPFAVHASTTPAHLLSTGRKDTVVGPDGQGSPVRIASPLPMTKEDARPSVGKASRPEDRRRASSFSARLSNVLSGKGGAGDRDRDSKKDISDVPGAEPSQTLSTVERAKSPAGNLLTRMGGGSSSPTSPSKIERKEMKQGGHPLRYRTSKGSHGEANDRTAESSSRSSPMRSVDESEGYLQASKSRDTFSTVSSSAGDGSPRKGKPKSSFLSTVRTWFEDKEKAGATRRKKQQQGQQQHQLHQSLAGRHKSVPAGHEHGVYGTGVHSVSRNGSLRRLSTATPHHPSAHPSSARKSPRHTMSHRGSLSRRSSSGSGQYPHPAIASTRPKNIRRPSAGSITPTATLNGEDLAYPFHQHHRGSRPSSAQSQRMVVGTGSGLHGKSGSASSTNSALRHPQVSVHSYSGSLRGSQARRSSLDGGTTVKRHRRYPSPHHHSMSMARSDSSHSRPTTPSKLGLLGSSDDVAEGLVAELHTPRRSMELEGSQMGRVSPMQTPRASQTVFVAHKSRTPYKPPSSNPMLHRTEHGEDLLDVDYVSKPRVGGAWRQSWGNPPPCWTGPVDQSAPSSRVAHKKTTGKLRDVFANKDSDDDWEDDEEEMPMYAGGLGQLDSVASSTTQTSKSSRYENDGVNRTRTEGIPTHIFGANRYAGVRSLFQPPSLGKETMPRAWIPSDADVVLSSTAAANLAACEGSKPDSMSTNSKDMTSTNPSRVRAPAPAFKGADILEEEEEEDT